MDVGVNVFTGRSVINVDVNRIDSLHDSGQGQRVVDMRTDIRIDMVIFKPPLTPLVQTEICQCQCKLC